MEQFVWCNIETGELVIEHGKYRGPLIDSNYVVIERADGKVLRSWLNFIKHFECIGTL